MAPKKSFLAMKQIICFQILILTFTETRTSKSDCTVMTFLGNGSNILSDSKEMVGCILGKSENKTELTQRYIKCVENCFLTKCYTSRPYCKLILSIVKTINNATKKNKKGFANPTSRDKCCLKDLHNIKAEDLLSSVPVSSPFPVSCSKGFFEITPEVTCEYTANKSSPVWSTKHPCVEIPNVWVKFNEISSENVSLTWNYTQIPSKVYYVNITVSCQLERLFGRTCSRHESATVHPEGPGEITCAALRPFSHYFLNFTVKVFNTRLKNKTQRLEFEGPLQNEVIFFNTSQTVPDKPEFHNSSFFSSGWIQWRPLSDCTGTIIAYELNYTGKRDYNDSFIETYSVLVNSSVTSYNLPNLKSATNYSLGIRGFTEAGAGEVSLGNFQTELKEPVIPETENLTAFNISSGTAVIPLHPVLDTNGPISSYQVIVLELESVSGRNRSLANICVRMDLAGFNSSSAGSIIYIAGEIPADNLSSLPEFTVGDGKLYGQYYNAQLQPEKNYSIIFRVISKWKQEVRFSCSEYEPFYVPAEVQHDASHQLLKICLYVFLPMTCTLLLVFLIFIWRCTPHHGKYIDNNALALSVTIQSDTMPVEQLIQHVIHMKQDCNREAESEEDGGLTKEFKSLPKSCFGTCEAAKNQSNKGKNRYKNSVPYDASRVMLTPSENHPGSDYINASYIDGFEKPKHYIATQGPLPNTITDFWKMVWQERTSVIVMLTNLVEGNKTKCEQYWPEQGSQIYNDLRVSLHTQTKDPEVTMRVFGLQKVGGCKHRIVRQLHYTAWPDHGTPRRPLSLLHLVRLTNNWWADNRGPIVVHCSAGIGRTGTFLAVHQLLAAAEMGHRVDVLQCVSNLRKNKEGMVQNEKQYMLIYNILLEALLCRDTRFPASQIQQRLHELQKENPHSHLTGYQMELQALDRLSEVFMASPHCEALKPNNKSKNRDLSILPAYIDTTTKDDRAVDGHHCPLMSVMGPDGSPGYVNAVFADSLTRNNRFIITQLPLKETIIDFWSLVYDYKCTTVVIMGIPKNRDEAFPVFWPESGFCTHGPFTVSLCSEEIKDGFTSRTLKLSHTKQKSFAEALQIKMLQLNNWPEKDILPKTRATIISMCSYGEECQREGNEETPTLVMCRDGACRSGLFCVASLLHEQLQSEGQVDVFQAVKMLRRVRPQIIKDMNQLIFCYQIAADYIDS